jgi:hypothetical protein
MAFLVCLAIEPQFIASEVANRIDIKRAITILDAIVPIESSSAVEPDLWTSGARAYLNHPHLE